MIGSLIRQLWSFAGDDDRQDVSQLLIQPFVNYNMEDGWYLVSSPIVTANWEADSDDTWTVPVGGGFGRIFGSATSRSMRSSRGSTTSSTRSSAPKPCSRRCTAPMSLRNRQAPKLRPSRKPRRSRIPPGEEMTETAEGEDAAPVEDAPPVEEAPPMAEPVPAAAPAYYPAVAPPPVTYSDPLPCWPNGTDYQQTGRIEYVETEVNPQTGTVVVRSPKQSRDSSGNIHHVPCSS